MKTASKVTTLRPEQITSQEFGDVVFHSLAAGTYPWVGYKMTAAGLPTGFMKLDAAKRSQRDGVYFSNTSTRPVDVCEETAHLDRNYHVSAGKILRRRKADPRVAVHVLVLDDIGTKYQPNGLPPTYKIESSKGNEQWGYVFKEPLSVQEAGVLFERVKAHGELGDSGALTIPRLLRAPAGVNGKTLEEGGKDPDFAVRLTAWHPDRLFTPEELIEAWDLPDADAPKEFDAKEKATSDQVLEHEVYAALSKAGVIQAQEGNKVFVTCPLEEEHSDGYDAQVKDTMVIFDADGGIGFHCLHEHQDAPNGPGYTDSDFKEWLFNETELDYRTAKSASVDDFEDLDEKDDGDWLGEEDDEDDWVGDQDAEDDRVGDQDAEAEPKKRMEAKKVPSAKSLVPTMDEVKKAKLTPRCIVEDYLYADVAQLVAAGGVGKTTLVLLEMIHIALGRTLWGLKVVSPGKTLLVTAEDEKEMLLARMRELMDAMDLTDEEQLYVIQHALIWDATETGRKLAKVEDYSGMMLVSDLAYEIAVKYAGEEFQVVTFDPTISFGASEARVNDNEQALVMAARVIKRRLKCCVRYIHHTGQDNAREKRLDQYAGRNGTALPDGTRMTAVMHPVVPDEKMKWQGAEETLPASLVADRRAYMVLSRPKLSYAPPQPLLWIARDGWSFEGEVGKVVTPVEREQAEYAKLNTFLLEELKLGQTHTINSLKEKVRDHGVKRASVDRIVKRMVRAGLTDEAELPRELRAGPKTKYLRPAEYSGVALPGEENWPSGEAI